MIVKMKKCLACEHPKDDHSVYREMCLHGDCTCQEMGGARDASGKLLHLQQAFHRVGTRGELINA